MMLLNLTGDGSFGPRIARKGGGGGGSSSTSTSGLDPTFKPFVQRGLTRAEGDWDRASANRLDPAVASAQADQTQLSAAQQGIGAAQQAISGTGEFDRRAANERALQNVAGQQLAGRSAGGSLTSARGDRAQQAALADVAHQQQLGREQQIQGGLASLQTAGQALSDVPHRENQRYFGYLGAAPGLQTSQSTSGSKQGK